MALASCVSLLIIFALTTTTIVVDGRQVSPMQSIGPTRLRRQPLSATPMLLPIVAAWAAAVSRSVEGYCRRCHGRAFGDYRFLPVSAGFLRFIKRGLTKPTTIRPNFSDFGGSAIWASLR